MELGNDFRGGGEGRRTVVRSNATNSTTRTLRLSAAPTSRLAAQRKKNLELVRANFELEVTNGGLERQEREAAPVVDDQPFVTDGAPATEAPSPTSPCTPLSFHSIFSTRLQHLQRRPLLNPMPTASKKKSSRRAAPSHARGAARLDA